jgi:hypothetical protein
MFVFIDIDAGTDHTDFMFNGSVDGGSNYNVVKTTTVWRAYHLESDSGYLQDRPGWDLAQSASDQQLMNELGTDADQSGSGVLHLFAPSSTTYVKHFYSRTAAYYGGNGAFDVYVSGYCNTTSAVNAVTFKMSSGTFSGTIQMYGIK